MGATAAAPAAAPQTLEQKILAVAQDAEAAVAIFSPAIATAVQAGIDIEPIVSGVIVGIIGLFKKQVAAPASATPAAS